MRFIRTLNQVQYSEPGLYGSRACDLARLLAERVPIPPTFILTAQAWEYFLEKNNIKYKIDFILQQVDIKNERTLQNAYNSVRKMLLAHPFPDEMIAEIKEAYETLTVGGVPALNEMMKEDQAPFVTMLSSPDYAAEAESYESIIQNIHGLEQVLLALKEIYAMAYTPEALTYRAKLGTKRWTQAIIIQEMLPARASATAYSTDPERQEMTFVQAYLGYTDLRDLIAKDFFHVKKEFLNIEGSQIVEQSKIIIREEDRELVPVEFREGRGQSLNDKEIMELARLAKKAEKALGNPAKIFYTITDKEFYILFANKYAVPKRVTPVPEEAAPELAPSVAVVPMPVKAEEPVQVIDEPAEEQESVQEQNEGSEKEPEPVEEPELAEGEAPAPAMTPEAMSAAAFGDAKIGDLAEEEAQDPPVEESSSVEEAQDSGIEDIDAKVLVPPPKSEAEVEGLTEEAPDEGFILDDVHEAQSEEFESREESGELGDPNEEEPNDEDDQEEDNEVPGEDEDSEDDDSEDDTDEDVEEDDDEESHEDDDEEDDQEDDQEEDDPEEDLEESDEDLDEDDESEGDTDEEDSEDDLEEEDDDLEEDDETDDEDDQEEDADDEEDDQEEDDLEEEDEGSEDDDEEADDEEDDSEEDDTDEEDDSEDDLEDEDDTDEDVEEDDDEDSEDEPDDEEDAESEDDLEDDDESDDEEADSEEDLEEESDGDESDDEDSEEELDDEDDDSEDDTDEDVEEDDDEESHEDDDEEDDQDVDGETDDDLDEDDTQEDTEEAVRDDNAKESASETHSEPSAAGKESGDEPEELDDSTKEMINKSFRIMYSELSKLYERTGEQAPDTITELIQQGTQKGVFNIEGLHEALEVKKMVRRGEPITEQQKNLVLGILNDLMARN